MKTKLLMAAFISCLAFSACTASGDKKSTDTSVVHQDSVNSGDGAAGTDTGNTPAKGGSSSAAIGGFDTSRAKLDTANTNPKK